MNRVRLATLIVVAGVLGACGASVNPQLKASIDAQVGQLPANGPVFGPPQSEALPELAVGDWVRFRDVNDKNENSIMTVKVVGQQGSAWWIENATETYYGRTVTLMLAELGDRTDPEQMKIERVLSKHGDRAPSEQPKAVLGVISSAFKPMLAQLSVRLKGDAQEDAAVPGGSFAQSYRRRVTMSLGGMTRTADTWTHPAVPINGSVKSRGIDYKGETELIGFGRDAVSEIGVPPGPAH